MPLDVIHIRTRLKDFDFRGLFLDLGWDHPETKSLTVTVEGQEVCLSAVAHKRGMVAFLCSASDGDTIPHYPLRRKIEQQVAKSVHEHIVIFTDAGQTTQVWQWVKREAGRPTACREHSYHRNQHGDALIQKLQALEVTLEEEEKLTILDAAGKAKAAFDVDKITKRFYDRFQKEHAAFLKFIKGIPSDDNREWYASLMLNRLMFVYFIQKKGFLDGDQNYLRNRLQMMQARKGKDKFLSFYRHFLLRLFHDGLNAPLPTRSPELDALLGTVPYLNGGLFDVHQLEEQDAEIAIPDQAFEKLFDYFDGYQWHLDERPLRADNEINPDVLGYIFEKYINGIQSGEQKAKGAYYTKEDITEYIGENTILPFLFDAAEKKCQIAFRPDSALWRLLRDNPDRYIYPAVRHGVDLTLPKSVTAGLKDVAKRDTWNQPAIDGFALPTEMWREHVARRNRCAELRRKLAAGEVHSINDLVTLNLDIRQFAQDAIESCEGPELLQDFFHAISSVSVLDPTCGSGAFLFAALNILEPLYEACLGRMQAFLDELDRSGENVSPKKYEDFRKTLAQIGQHRNLRYFILKSIIINNLYGVDIMEEAVEICKLRLFLKLVAQVENVGQIEPLPDIDFNIRAGNTLVGYVSVDEIRQAIERERGGQRKLAFSDSAEEVARIEEAAEVASRDYQQFREMQTEQGMEARSFAEAKCRLRNQLNSLARELDRYLAGDYGIDLQKKDALGTWRDTHHPFHWFAEFHGIMHNGGFDVIIGNPPWVEYSKVRKQYTVRAYETEVCGNLHGICTERGLSIRSTNGRMSFIVQLPLVSSSRMVKVREVLRKSSKALYVIPFDDRPGKLFDGLQHCRSVIWISQGRNGGARTADLLAVTRYQRWPTECRPYLFQQVEYAIITAAPIFPDQFPKCAHNLQADVFQKVKAIGRNIVGEFLTTQSTGSFIFYQEATQYWAKATVGLPFYSKNGKVGAPAHGRYLYFRKADMAYATCALLNSSLFYAYFVAFGDCFHLSDTLVRSFPVPPGILETGELSKLGLRLMEDLKAGAERKTINTKDGDVISYDEYFGRKAKPTIDEIDEVLAHQYGFTGEEANFIANFDFKFRMRADDDTGEEG